MTHTVGLKEWQEAENDLGRAYLRLRTMIGHNAFQTPYGPTPEQVWETTENALKTLLAEHERYKAMYRDLCNKIRALSEAEDERPL